MTGGHEYFEGEIGTFRADRLFCDSLLASRQAGSVAELIVYYAWARACLPHLQKDFLQLVPSHFHEDVRESAHFWTFSFLLAIMKDISLVPHLVIRGVISEAGSALRRALEHIGVLTHIWADPAKIQFLGDFDSKDYCEAFLSERNKT